jgi:hypothetical protein
MAAVLSPWKAGVPVRHWNSTQPSANTSVLASIGALLRACSGAMYPGVPIIAPVWVSWVRPLRCAMPKSSTLT